MRINLTLGSVLFCLLTFTVRSQDVHFTQFFNAPMLLNPALTGLMSNDVRAAVNYRTQWTTLSTPYQSMSASADFSPARYIFNTDDIVGIGFFILNDKAGTSELTNTQIQGSLAYSKSLDGQGNNFLSIGGQVGYGQQRLNTQNLTFDNQIEGNVLNTSLDNGESLNFENFSYWDVSAGLAWSYTPEKSTNIYAGISAAHLNEPQVSFFNDETELLYRRYSAYAGGQFRVSYGLSLLPRGYYLQQGPSKELTLGVLAKLNMSDRRSKDLSSIYLGAMYRAGDAVIAIIKYDFNEDFSVSFNYDINTSALSHITRGYGAMELAIVYQTSFRSRGRSNRAIQAHHF